MYGAVEQKNYITSRKGYIIPMLGEREGAVKFLLGCPHPKFIYD